MRITPNSISISNPINENGRASQNYRTNRTERIQETRTELDRPELDRQLEAKRVFNQEHYCQPREDHQRPLAQAKHLHNHDGGGGGDFRDINHLVHNSNRSQSLGDKETKHNLRRTSPDISTNRPITDTSQYINQSGLDRTGRILLHRQQEQESQDHRRQTNNANQK